MKRKDETKGSNKKFTNMINKHKRQEVRQKNKKEVMDWIRKHLKYSSKNNEDLYFITVRYGKLYRPNDYEKARSVLRSILKSLYEVMFGRRRWINKIGPSITVIEKGRQKHLHSHTIIRFPCVDDELLMGFWEYAVYRNPQLMLKVKLWKSKSERDSCTSNTYCPEYNDVVIEPIGNSLKDLNRVIKYMLKEYRFNDRNKIDFLNLFDENLLFRIIKKKD